MTDVEKSEILNIWYVCDVENVAIHAKFMIFSWKHQFCRKISFVVITHFCVEKNLSKNFLCGEKMTNITSQNGRFHIGLP